MEAKKFILLLIVALPLFSLGQNRFEFLNSSNPYNNLVRDPYALGNYYLVGEQLNTTGIQKRVMLMSSKRNGFKLDTLAISYFNIAGLKEKETTYRDNAPSNFYQTYQYDKEGYLKEKLVFDAHNSITNRTKYYYDDNGNMVEFRSYNTNDKDTVPVQTKIYRYNDNKPILWQVLAYKKVTLEAKYNYKDGRLDNCEFSGAAGAKFKKCTYNAKGQIIAVKEYVAYNGNEEIYTEALYEYDDQNRITKESFLPASNIATKEYQVSNYTYDSADRLIYMEVLYKGRFRRVTWNYEGDLVKTVKVITDARNGAYFKLWMDSTIEITDGEPTEYEERYEYDAKGNLIGRKTFANGLLHAEIVCINTYWK